MTMPKKGSRSIAVGDTTYRWIVSPRAARYERPHTMAAPVVHLRLSLVVEAPTGAQFVAKFDAMLAVAVPSAGFSDVQDIAIAPRTVRRAIEYARRELHWNVQDPKTRVVLEHAAREFPEAVWLDGHALDRSYDPARLSEYLQGAVCVWTRDGEVE